MAEILVLSNETILWTDYLSLGIVGLVLGFYFLFFIEEQLPAYYDENKVNFYNDGIIRINLFHLSFNNRNWKIIIPYIRYWSISLLIAAPLIEYLIFSFVSVPFKAIVLMLLIIVSLSPLYFLAKKYE